MYLLYLFWSVSFRPVFCQVWLFWYLLEIDMLCFVIFYCDIFKGVWQVFLYLYCKCECVTRLAGWVCSSINHLPLPKGQVTSHHNLQFFFCYNEHLKYPKNYLRTSPSFRMFVLLLWISTTKPPYSAKGTVHIPHHHQFLLFH